MCGFKYNNCECCIELNMIKDEYVKDELVVHKCLCCNKNFWFFEKCGFLKNVSSKERVKPWFFATFNIISKHIFPENSIEFPQVVQKI